tara:strand:+ start:826 stop:1614 length:789 start_codon:yes stop_codon:yes gene_type:complete
MMAKIIDPVKVDEEVNASVSEEPEVQEEVAEVPEQYRDKSPAELIKMHQELETKLGNQGNELGELRGAKQEVTELRKVVDDFILNQSSNDKAKEPAQEVDFFADPDKAVEDKIANHPLIKEAQQTTLQIQQNQAKQVLLEKHPDVAEIIQDQEFVNWVKGSPIRTELLTRADQQFDSAAADELFSNWKQLKSVSNSTDTTEKDVRKETLKKVSTGGATGSTQTSSKKIYKRADIIELMKTDPKRYRSMEPELRLAYAENRVR